MINIIRVNKLPTEDIKEEVIDIPKEVPEEVPEEKPKKKGRKKKDV